MLRTFISFSNKLPRTYPESLMMTSTFKNNQQDDKYQPSKKTHKHTKDNKEKKNQKIQKKSLGKKIEKDLPMFLL